MTIAELTDTVRGKVAGGGIDESVKFDCGDDGVILVKGSEVSNDDADADCTIGISKDNLAKLLAGDLNPTTAFMTGKIKVSGDMSIAMKLGSIV
ncbi:MULTISPECIES: SCP2 sterol-binding domain-containing protein [Stappia]|uniref:SCP2 sterol-binding domain-containing protein n=1 Tax=Stappia taiwanensis TaxID=992267 RepID=A0A838XVA2_9HYPH|nr:MULTISPECIES: SCP2 sterol-binding domain-containing protein [Stappia]MBA4612416.1 SCP2 sterol-binding domain-containing protein [Stappia taiwanensis]MCA1298350.1 SCP2 sterol-binding domain-containing protein [Stappia indica]GGF05208.1 sterol-binding protein [Stappia taiwanensis]